MQKQLHKNGYIRLYVNCGSITQVETETSGLFEKINMIRMDAVSILQLKSVKCYPGERKTDLISSISEIQSQT